MSSRVDSARRLTSSDVMPSVEIGGRTGESQYTIDDIIPIPHTLQAQLSAVHPGPSVEQSPVVLADNGNDGDLRLNGEVECAFLERE